LAANSFVANQQSIQIVVHSKNYVSTKASKEIIPFQLEFSIYTCNAKHTPGLV